ncbi:MAG: HAMP domain-containing histidine kinase [Clostridiales bacterium]|nr:HAMP domain-containing histidine kinase [Clostridiales bacterium]
MKKHYTRITIAFTSLILVAFLLGGGFYTYVCAAKIMNDKMDEISFHWWVDRPYMGNSSYTYDELILDTYCSHWRYNDLLWNYEHVGVYDRLILGDGRVFEPRDFVSVYRHDSDSGYLENTRIFFTDEPLEIGETDDYIWHTSISGTCDNVFIYDGTLEYRNASGFDITEYEYKIPGNEYGTGGNEMDVSEWLGDEGCDVRYSRMAGSREDERLNSEAEKLLDGLLSDPETDPRFGKTEKSLITSYYVVYDATGRDSDHPAESYAVYLYHPLQIAFLDHIPVYVTCFIALAVIEILVILFMRRLYRNRMDLELRSRDLTRSIAHDLKTPLAVTQAYVENWEYIDEEDRHEYSEKLNQEVHNMDKMVTELLSIQKMDSGEQKLNLEDVELASLATSVYNQMKPVITERGLDVAIIKDDRKGSYVVNADLEMIRTVMGNFISNAVKYADTKVRIKLMGNDRYVTFMVSNDGEPISNSELKKVWDAFYKKDNSRTDRIGSSGMGLAISRSILKLHKAKYGAVSDGSMVSFWFRMKRVR